jgi:4-amino-4-deoxy-L-arabinose transferase-like glycosyltransferase
VLTRHTHVLANSSESSSIVARSAAVIAVVALYLTGLTRMGMYSTDEPRYAAIGRAMAQSGDWITPKLWGQPWFEKPALLYWMTAAGFKLGLGPDLAPRLPVALLSVAFLWFFWLRLKRIFDGWVALCATSMLATTAGWLAYSHVAVTDLPLAALFSAAVLWALVPKAGEPNRIAAAVALALAVLAKGLPPLVLFLPLLAMDYRNWRRWFLSWPLTVFILVALPWYAACTLRNGWSFPYTFFIEHQFDRFRTNALQHAQPWWFYGPVFLLLMFPWFPLLALTVRHLRKDENTRRLAAVVAFGLVFFSASVNKLPGYVLPLIPATCALTAVALCRAAHRERWLMAPIAMLGVLPASRAILPEAVAHGLRTAQIPWPAVAWGIVAGAALGLALAFWPPMRSRALIASVFLAAAGFIWMEIVLFPALDQAGSARALWAESHPDCAPVLPRGILYGLNYYSEKELPDCAIVDKNAAPFNHNDQKR